MVNDGGRKTEASIQLDLISRQSFEWLWVIDIFVILSYFGQETIFQENLLSELTYLATVYLLIFLGESDRRLLISSHPALNGHQSKWTCSLDDKELLVPATTTASLYCNHSRLLLLLLCRLWTLRLSVCFSDKRVVFLSSPFENVKKKKKKDLSCSVPMYTFLSKCYHLVGKC